MEGGAGGRGIHIAKFRVKVQCVLDQVCVCSALMDEVASTENSTYLPAQCITPHTLGTEKQSHMCAATSTGDSPKKGGIRMCRTRRDRAPSCTITDLQLLGILVELGGFVLLAPPLILKVQHCTHPPTQEEPTRTQRTGAQHAHTCSDFVPEKSQRHKQEHVAV